MYCLTLLRLGKAWEGVGSHFHMWNFLGRRGKRGARFSPKPLWFTRQIPSPAKRLPKAQSRLAKGHPRPRSATWCGFVAHPAPTRVASVTCTGSFSRRCIALGCLANGLRSLLLLLFLVGASMWGAVDEIGWDSETGFRASDDEPRMRGRQRPYCHRPSCVVPPLSISLPPPF